MLIGFHIAILLTLGISFVAILPAYVPFFAEVMPRRSLPTVSAEALVAGVLSVVALVAVAASIPDATAWLLSWVPLEPEVVGGVALLLLPALFLRKVALQATGRFEQVATPA